MYTVVQFEEWPAASVAVHLIVTISFGASPILDVFFSIIGSNWELSFAVALTFGRLWLNSIVLCSGHDVMSGFVLSILREANVKKTCFQDFLKLWGL